MDDFQKAADRLDTVLAAWTTCTTISSGTRVESAGEAHWSLVRHSALGWHVEGSFIPPTNPIRWEQSPHAAAAAATSRIVEHSRVAVSMREAAAKKARDNADALRKIIEGA